VTKSQQKSLRSIQDILLESPVKTQHVQLLKQNQAHSVLLSTIQELLPDSNKPHCLSAQLKYDLLIVHTDSSAWASKLRFQLATMLPTLRRQDGYHLASKVVVRVQPQQTARSSNILNKSRMDKSTAKQIRELASAIRDENLRQRWLKLAENAETDNPV
jgi:hypothetical protein